MSSKHSSLVGGSTVGRLLACPGSWAAIQALPPSADVPSSFAEEGSFAHEVMARLMNIRRTSEQRGIAFNPFVEARKLQGLRIYDRELTQEHLDTLIEPAILQLVALEAEYGGGFSVESVEARVAFPGIVGAFGTADLLLGSATHAVLADYKFGQGVPVKAVYRDAEGERLNAQLLYYLTAALHTARRLFVRRKLVIAIIQPRTDEPLTHAEVSRKETNWFREDVAEAVLTALDRDPPLRKGENCRWCPAKVSCPLWVNSILDLSALKHPPRVASDARAPAVTVYGAYLARAKTLVDLLAMFKKEVDDQLHAYLEDGGLVPGWRLKAKSKQRQWIDDATVVHALEDLGFESEEIFQTKLVTFAAADATARKRGVKIPDHLRVAPSTTETTVAATDDPAPVIDRAGAAVAFQTALKALAAPDPAIPAGMHRFTDANGPGE